MSLETTVEAARWGSVGAASAAGMVAGPQAEDLAALAAEAARREREDAAWVERMLKSWETDPEVPAPWPAEAGDGGWEDCADDESRWDPDDVLEAWRLEGADACGSGLAAGDDAGCVEAADPAAVVLAAARAAVAGLPRKEAGEALFAGFRAAFGEWAEGANGVRDGLDAAELLTKTQRWAESEAARALAGAALDAGVEGQDGRNVVEEHGLRTAQTLFDARRLARAGRAGLGYPQIREAQKAGVFPAASCDAVMAAANRVGPAELKVRVVEAGIRLALSAPASKLRAGVSMVASRLDPGAAGKARREAKDGRNVRVWPKPDGMAELRAYGPAEDVRLVQAAVEAAARKLGELERAREDAKRLTAGLFQDGAQDGAGAPGGEDGGAEGAGSRPGWLDREPRTQAQREFDVFAKVWKRDPGVDGMPATAGEAAAAPHVLVKIPAETLLGFSEEPGELAATGEPVPAEAARRIAECATWQALVEHAGRVVGLGKKIHPPGFLGDPSMWPAEARGAGSYRAPGWLRLVLEARGGGCSKPNCQAPPGRCDADHVVRFDPGKPAKGQTKGSNLQWLCRACHLRKTHHGWEYVRDVETGETTITTPNGHTAKSPPPELPEAG